MKKKVISITMSFVMAAAALAGCGDSSNTKSDATSAKSSSGATTNSDFAGEELSILVSAGWMDNRYDDTIARFEKEYDVSVDLQTIPADQYIDILQSKLSTDSVPDVFWIQSNPFAIDSVIVDPEKYCIDFTGAEWADLMPESRLASCESDGKLYGLQIWHNSPEYVFVYNKTLFEELKLDIPTTYDELLSVCKTLKDNGVSSPWLMPGADGWQHQLAFFQIGGVFEEATPGLYEGLNNNMETFSGNKKMLEVLEQYKELSDKGYLGEDWIGTDSTNMQNDFADRNCGMALANSSYIKQIVDETGTEDEFGLFLEPLGDNDTFPTNPAGPTMFGSKSSSHPELVKAFFDFVTTTESLQEILDNSPAYTNLDVNDENLEQHWLPEEEEFMKSIDESKMETAVLQSGTKYTNDYWSNFGQDLVAYCQDQMDADQVLSNMDKNRAEAAKVANDEAWQ